MQTSMNGNGQAEQLLDLYTLKYSTLTAHTKLEEQRTAVQQIGLTRKPMYWRTQPYWFQEAMVPTLTTKETQSRYVIKALKH